MSSLFQNESNKQVVNAITVPKSAENGCFRISPYKECKDAKDNVIKSENLTNKPIPTTKHVLAKKHELTNPNL